jgi:hypothetical protein
MLSAVLAGLSIASLLTTIREQGHARFPRHGVDDGRIDRPRAMLPRAPDLSARSAVLPVWPLQSAPRIALPLEKHFM